MNQTIGNQEASTDTENAANILNTSFVKTRKMLGKKKLKNVMMKRKLKIESFPYNELKKRYAYERDVDSIFDYKFMNTFQFTQEYSQMSMKLSEHQFIIYYDLLTLRTKKWLNHEVINACHQIFQQEFPSKTM